MRGTPHFLRLLDLEPDADERAVRRAYAKRLKLIDQAADPQGFQALRMAYEAALRWVGEQARQRQADAEAQADTEAAATVEQPEPDAERAAPEAPLTSGRVPVDTVSASPHHATEEAAVNGVAEEAPPSPQALGDQVFAEFAAHAAQGFKDEPSAQRALEHALADERLVNLDARTLFEWRAACLLIEGWRPGHEFLLAPACKCFAWEEDRRRLALFGQVGAGLNAAIDERLMFFSLSAVHFEERRRIIQRLRDDAHPEPERLLQDVPLLHQLTQRYPNWLRIVTSRDNIVQWHRSWDALPKSQREASDKRTQKHTQKQSELKPSAKPPAASNPKSSIPIWGIVMVLFILVRLITSLSGSDAAPHYAPRVSLPAAPVAPTRPTEWSPYYNTGTAPNATPLPYGAQPIWESSPTSTAQPAATRARAAAEPKRPASRDARSQPLSATLPAEFRIDLPANKPTPRQARAAELAASAVFPLTWTERSKDELLTERVPLVAAPASAARPRPVRALESTPSTTALPAAWTERSKYELLRGADGSVSTPRLGGSGGSQ